MIYIKRNQLPKLMEIINDLPEHEFIDEEKSLRLPWYSRI